MGIKELCVCAIEQLFSYLRRVQKDTIKFIEKFGAEEAVHHNNVDVNIFFKASSSHFRFFFLSIVLLFYHIELRRVSLPLFFLKATSSSFSPVLVKWPPSIRRISPAGRKRYRPKDDDRVLV